MTPLQQAIEMHGGLMAAFEIRATLHVGPGAISRAVTTGEILRVRQGWYADPWLGLDEQLAARVGGQLACSSAAGRLGMWEPVALSTHVCVPPNAARLRSPASYRDRLDGRMPVEVHWTGLDPLGTRTVVSPARCIEQIASCEAPEIALAVAESALHRGVLGMVDWQTALAGLPRRVQRLLGGAGRGSESGTESVFRYRMAEAGVSVRQQVWIGGVRVDCLIGERLVVEIDSRRFHADATADRQRDALLSALGYRVLRFDYFLVMEQWPVVEAAVLAALARGDHLLPNE